MCDLDRWHRFVLHGGYVLLTSPHIAGIFALKDLLAMTLMSYDAWLIGLFPVNVISVSVRVFSKMLCN